MTMKRGRAGAEAEVMSIMSRVTDRSAGSPSEPEEVNSTLDMGTGAMARRRSASSIAGRCDLPPNM